MHDRSIGRDEAMAFLLSSHGTTRVGRPDEIGAMTAFLASAKPTSSRARSSTWMAARLVRSDPGGFYMAFAPEQITARLAEFAVDSNAADWPDAVRLEASRSFFNVFGCAIGGARHEMVDIADTTLGAFAGPGQATLFGRGRKADILHTTLINGLASSIYSFDDTHEVAVVHPSGPIAAAVLALAELRPVLWGRSADRLCSWG